MVPSALGVRLASGVVAPLVRKLFVKDGPGAGLVAKPVRISGPVSFTGERRTLSDQDLHKIAAELVARAVRTAGPGAALPAPGRFLEAVGCPVTGSQPAGWTDRVLAARPDRVAWPHSPQTPRYCT